MYRTMYNRHIIRVWLLAALALLFCERAAAQRQTPSAPTGLTIEILAPTDPLGGYGATLSWEASPEDEGVSSYNVYVKEVREWGSGEGTFEFFAETDETSITFSSDQLNFGGAAYAYYVTAVSEGGESDPSNTVSSACGRPWNDGDLGEYNGTGTSQIVSDPPLSIEIGQPYRYDVNTIADFSQTTDHRPFYSLARRPDGMTINEETGEILWTPTESGVYNVVVNAEIPTLDESDQQVWRVTVTGSVSGVEDQQDPSLLSQVYPNPAADKATLQFLSSGGERRIALVDSRGAEVFSTVVPTTRGTNLFALDLQGRSAGSYVVVVRGGEETTTIPVRLAR